MNLLQTTAHSGEGACRYCTDILEKRLSFFGGKIQAIGGKIDAVALPSWWPFDWGKRRLAASRYLTQRRGEAESAERFSWVERVERAWSG